MMEIFLDASVLFSAAYSQTGASWELINLGIQDEVELVISELVYRGAKRNLKAKAPEVVSALDTIRQEVPFKTVKSSMEEIVTAAKYTFTKRHSCGGYSKDRTG